jgi:cytosine/uracil/thiamine/allantoin permease
MNQFIQIVIIGSLIVILFDTLASLVSRKFHLDYGRFSTASFSIYTLIGFFAVKYTT